MLKPFRHDFRAGQSQGEGVKHEDEAAKIKRFDAVALLEGLPQEGLVRGQIGAVIEVYPNGEYEVEFVDEGGQTYAQLALRPDQVMRLHRSPRHALKPAA
jgi:hypothetical protein